MAAKRRGFIRFTLDLPRDLHRALKRYAFENDLHASEVVRDLIRDFLAAKTAGDRAVEAAVYRRGYEAGATAERDRIAKVVHPALSTLVPRGLPTSLPGQASPVDLPCAERHG